MSWLDPKNIHSDGNLGTEAEAKVSRFIQESGCLGSIALEAWNGVDPLHCLYSPDEYLGYARRFVEGATGITPSEWSNHPDLVEELVRRSFYPTQVCYHTGLGQPWATTKDIKAISQHITERVEQLGGMEKLLPES